jgi:hypothetical protein
VGRGTGESDIGGAECTEDIIASGKDSEVITAKNEIARIEASPRGPYARAFQLSRGCYPPPSPPGTGGDGISKAIASWGISGELVDSATISISDFSGRA